MTRDAFWRAHLRLLAICLFVWFGVSFGAGILFAEALDAIVIGNVPLGFWFAQQGSIYCFLLLVVIYTWRVGLLEQKLRSSAGELDGHPAGNESGDG